MQPDTAPDPDWRTLVGGFVAGLATLGALLWVIGIEETLETLTTADGRILAGIALAAITWQLCWGLALREVLSTLDVPVSVPRAFLIITAGTCLNNVTPSGEPFTALVIARATDSRYETGFAALASLKVINVIPTVTAGTVGVVFVLTQLSTGDRTGIVAPMVVLVSVLTTGGVAAYLLWDRVQAVAVAYLPWTVRTLTRPVPRLRPSRKAVVDRVDRFFQSLEWVASDRRTLARAVALSAMGWSMVGVCLWLSLLSLGHRVSVTVPALVVPIGTTASATPLPGGLGGSEVLYTSLVAETTGLTLATAGAAVLVYRGGTYWLPICVGAASLGAVGFSRQKE